MKVFVSKVHKQWFRLEIVFDDSGWISMSTHHDSFTQPIPMRTRMFQCDQCIHELMGQFSHWDMSHNRCWHFTLELIIKQFIFMCNIFDQLMSKRNIGATSGSFAGTGTKKIKSISDKNVNCQPFFLRHFSGQSKNWKFIATFLANL